MSKGSLDAAVMYFSSYEPFGKIWELSSTAADDGAAVSPLPAASAAVTELLRPPRRLMRPKVNQRSGNGNSSVAGTTRSIGRGNSSLACGDATGCGRSPTRQSRIAQSSLPAGTIPKTSQQTRGVEFRSLVGLPAVLVPTRRGS